MTVEGCARPRKLAAQRHTHPPKACCVIDRNAIAVSARTILTRMRSNEASRGSGSYLFIQPDGSAFILNDDASIALDWIKDHIDWLVGFYSRFAVSPTMFAKRMLPPMGMTGPAGVEGLVPTMDSLVDDITDHFASATDGRQYVGLQQTGEVNSLQPATGVAALQRPEAGLAAEGDNSASGGGASIEGAE